MGGEGEGDWVGVGVEEEGEGGGRGEDKDTVKATLTSTLTSPSPTANHFGVGSATPKHVFEAKKAVWDLLQFHLGDDVIQPVIVDLLVFFF